MPLLTIMLFPRLAVLLGTALTVSAFPALENRAVESNSSMTVGGFEVVITYVQPEGGCPARRECRTQNPLASTIPTPTPSRVSIPETPAFSQAAPTAKLVPNVHWGCDTAPATNVIPIPANDGSLLYYGHNGKGAPSIGQGFSCR